MVPGAIAISFLMTAPPFITNFTSLHFGNILQGIAGYRDHVGKLALLDGAEFIHMRMISAFTVVAMRSV